MSEEIPSAFHALGLGEPDELLMKAELVLAITSEIQMRSLGPSEAAKALGMPRQELAHLLKGRISRFTIDRLVRALGQIAPAIRVRVLLETRQAGSP